jgi:hypothetical protein
LLKPDQFTHCWIDTTYIFISKAFFFTFILTFFFPFPATTMTHQISLFALAKTVFVQSLPFPCKIKTFCFYLSVILVGLIYAFLFTLSSTSSILESHCSIVESTFWTPVELFIFKSFRIWNGVLLKTRGIFCLLSLLIYREMTSELINKQSFELPFELLF